MRVLATLHVGRVTRFHACGEPPMPSGKSIHTRKASARRLPPAALLVVLTASLFGMVADAAPSRVSRPGQHDVRRTVERARALMGTACTITAEGLDSSYTSTAVDDAFAEIDRLERVLSSWRTDSELARINAEGPERRIECSPDFFAVLDSSLAIARET